MLPSPLQNTLFHTLFFSGYSETSFPYLPQQFRRPLSSPSSSSHRFCTRSSSSDLDYIGAVEEKYDVIVVGGGHACTCIWMRTLYFLLRDWQNKTCMSECATLSHGLPVLVLTTNRPGDLDSAAVEQINEAGLEKSGLTNLFKRKQQQIEIMGLTDDIIREAEAITEGFSGREIAKVMASVQAAVHRSEKNCVLDSSLFHEVANYKVAEQHKQGRKLAAANKVSARGLL
ncbi:hypothetical protein K1719_018464 [Acacia pycnantha]|nr:hypothetical protein K1719_018464 [Acacia pycnantha]